VTWHKTLKENCNLKCKKAIFPADWKAKEERQRPPAGGEEGGGLKIMRSTETGQI
jgi:hypothetical protein